LPDLDAAGQRRVTQRLMELYRVAGRVEAYEGLVRVELERQDLPSDVRARLARDLAASLASRGEIGPALDMLVPVAAQRPRDEQLQEELLVLAERLENTPRRIDALRQLVVCSLEEHTRLERLRTLAALLEEQGDEEGALPYYAEIALLRPEPRALVALERDAERRGDYAELVGLFARRAALASSPDEVRRIRLRRAAVLEQRLGKPEDARNELEGLLRETGEHLSVLRMLADSNERLGSPERAAPLWEQASKLASSLEERVELRLRAARAHHQAGDLDAARAVLQRDAEVVAHPAVNDLVKTLDREAHDPTLRAQSFERLAAGTAHPANARAQWLVEAAHAYISAGDLDKAAGTAEGALRLAPNLIDAQLTLRWCKHLENGPGSAEQARLMVAELRAIRGVLTPQQAEVRTFLIAEALDAAVGAGAGLRELRGMEADLGPLPLIALGIAERQEQSNPDAALGSYEQALQGDLRQARAPGAVAMAAASLARRLGKLTHALEFLERAAADPSTREAARDLEYAIRAELERPRGAASAPNAAQLEAPRAPTPLDIERLKWPQTSSPDRILSPVPAPHSSPPGGLQTPRDATETVGRYSIRTPGQPEPVSDAMSPAPPSSGPVSPVQAAGRYSAHAEPEVIGIAHASPRGLRSAQEISSPRIVISHGLADAGSIPPADDAEAALLRELLEAGPGAVDAGRRLIGILEHYPDRTHDLVTVCRRVVELLPGDQGALERLHAAARADKNFGYARAIEHVMSLTSASGASIAPPPLSDQPEQPELVRAMLFRDTLTNGAQALAFVWEGAEHVFRRDATAYGITGLERVQLGAPMPLARVYSSAARALGATRTALYQRRTPGSISLSVALMSPPAVIISGEIREESSALRFHLGAMLTAAMSEYALLFGTSESEARAVLRALALAFGPPQRQSHGSLAQAANLAEVLWESVPARSQRRLRELCDVPDELEYEVVMESAWHALRRAGLFVCGDLEAALRETCSTLGLSDENLRQPGGLAALCAANEAAKDLVSLATSPMYAETRWQPARGGGQRHSTGQWVVH
jgi:tetratricopeptide (TPR) repeat protein